MRFIALLIFFSLCNLNGIAPADGFNALAQDTIVEIINCLNLDNDVDFKAFATLIRLNKNANQAYKRHIEQEERVIMRHPLTIEGQDKLMTAIKLNKISWIGHHLKNFGDLNTPRTYFIGTKYSVDAYPLQIASRWNHRRSSLLCQKVGALETIECDWHFIRSNQILIKELINNCRNVNHRDHAGNTLLVSVIKSLAIEGEHGNLLKELLELLAKKGADFAVKDSTGRDVVSLVKRYDLTLIPLIKNYVTQQTKFPINS